MLKQILHKRMVTIVCSIASFVLLLPASHADIIYYIDADRDAPGIQGTRTVTSNSTFSVDLLMELVGDSSLDAYRASIEFESTGLAFLSATATPLINYSPQVGGLTFDTETIGPFEGASDSIGMGIVAPQGPFVIGTLSFTSLDATGSFRIDPIEIADLDGSFDNSFNKLTPVFNRAIITISAVPEPSTLATLGIAIASYQMLLRYRHFKTRKSTKVDP